MVSPALAVVPSALVIRSVTFRAVLDSTRQTETSLVVCDLSHGLQADELAAIFLSYGQATQLLSERGKPVSGGYGQRLQVELDTKIVES